jgi:hypothetical protein
VEGEGFRVEGSGFGNVTVYFFRILVGRGYVLWSRVWGL